MHTQNYTNDKKIATVLTLDADGAMNFFLKSEQYIGFELPEYFVFDELLNNVKKAIADSPWEECITKRVSPDQLPDVNLDILLNKDGRYAVRPIIVANPFLYYFMVRELCNELSWTIVKDLFKKFQVPHITSCALPIIPKENESFHKSTTILNWWSTLEQRSVELSLEYQYMFVTDITNCYGSVNPQAFDWAFSLKDTKHERKYNNSIPANIQKYLRAFQHGRNIGIPQGSSIFDFVGEIILGYSDLLLHEAIKDAGITAQYEILRYRDDYRVFCNDKAQLEKISYILQHVLEGLNFRMNSGKTKISESIVTDAIKPDKLAYIYNTPIFNKKGVDFDSFEKHLLYILLFARQHPGSGSVTTLLSDIDKRIKKWLLPQEQKENENESSTKQDTKAETFIRHIPGGSVRAMAAVCTQIALENVGRSHYALRVLSRIVDSLSDEQEKCDIMGKVRAKLINQPNSGYNQLWLQNITYQYDKKQGKSPYDMRLCRIVAGDTDTILWNNSWIKPKLRSKLKISDIVDIETLKKVTPVITFRETRAYDEALANAQFSNSPEINSNSAGYIVVGAY